MRLAIARLCPWLVCLCLVARAAPAADPPADERLAVLNAVTAKAADKGVTVRLDFSEPVTWKETNLNDPPRAVFDFAGARPRMDQTQAIEVKHRLLQGVRVGLYSEEPPVTRVVLDLAQPVEVRVARANGGKTLFVGVGEGAGRPERRPDPPAASAITATTWDDEGERSATFVLRVSPLPRANCFYLDHPERVVLDLDGATLPGDVSQPGKDNGLVDKVRVSRLDSGVVRCVFDLSHPAGHQLMRRLAPDRILVRFSQGATRGRLVVVDAGHGGVDPGTSGYRAELKEKTVNLSVALRVARLLDGKGVKCTLTRDDDTLIPLHDRPKMANELGADLFVSIHCNAMPDDQKGQRSGTELYYYTGQSSAFASLMLKEVTEEIGLTARGTFTRPFVVVKESAMPAVLVELGYLDNVGDGKKLESDEFQQKCAAGIARGIVRQLQRLPMREPATLESGTARAGS